MKRQKKTTTTIITDIEFATVIVRVSVASLVLRF